MSPGITRLEITRTESFAGGQAFGSAGPYVKIVGVAHGELDPAAPGNRAIVNLDLAPRNVRGLVEYAVDFYILRPADPSKGHGVLLYEVTNRGRKFLLNRLHEAKETLPGALNEPALPEHAGNGFAFSRGYSLLWSGWDPDAPVVNGGMRIHVPVATRGGEPIVRTIRDEFVFVTRLPGSPTAPLSYEAATRDQSQARLTVRAREASAPVEIAAGGWTYKGPRAIALLPEGTPFTPGFIYDFRYPAKDPKVLGIAYAATRDLVSFLRHDRQAAITTVLAFGISQGGRYLRDHVAGGFNRDDSDRKVFDGVLAHIAGAGRVFTNWEFGQPNRTSTQHEDHLFPENAFPFAHATLTDPVTRQTGALLRGDGSDPLIMEVNTSTEYWQKGASLLHTDPLGKGDVSLPDGVRVYLVAGTQHGGHAAATTDPGQCRHARNPHNPMPLLRALLVALESWVVAGVAPPPSRVPTFRDATLVDPLQLAFPAIPGVDPPRATNRLALFGDWTDPRPQAADAYVTLVPQVDADGNERAGVRLPSIAVPTATYTGWNWYKAPALSGELCDREGAYVPFALTKAERERTGDPRRSLEERYGDRRGWLARLRAATAELVAERLLLPEDAERLAVAAEQTDPFKSIAS